MMPYTEELDNLHGRPRYREGFLSFRRTMLNGAVSVVVGHILDVC